ncbi:unnamed protein product [Larinioides sclopetarius]|uniref:Uncharacterized protein n=1 Tax=Larinioides sclopetarius TaxID=280406 RepID=A0AAV1ZNE7_9ARAC
MRNKNTYLVTEMEMQTCTREDNEEERADEDEGNTQMKKISCIEKDEGMKTFLKRPGNFSRNHCNSSSAQAEILAASTGQTPFRRRKFQNPISQPGYDQLETVFLVGQDLLRCLRDECEPYHTSSSQPAGLESRGLGIHQGQPSYLPAYNGIFSIHALNFTPSAVDKTENYIHVGNQESILNYASNASLENSATTNESPATLTEKDETDYQSPNAINLHLDDGTESNEVDSPTNKKDDLPKIAEPATFPQIQVVTKTISEETFQPTTSTTTEATTVTTAKEELARNEVTATVEISLDENHRYTHSNESETLLSGTEEDPVETDDKQDIFDNFIEPIQTVWQEFVGKLKMSVLEVWKSISHHLMERLESFATTP